MVCSTDPFVGGKGRLERKGLPVGAGHPGRTGHLDEDKALGHTMVHLDETWICVDGRGPPSH